MGGKYRSLLDFDGTVSTRDIGLDYLHAHCGIERGQFFNYVKAVRENVLNPSYARHFEDTAGVPHDFGIELAYLLILNRARRSDVLESGSQSTNSIRSGFLSFLKKAEESGNPVDIVSSGPADWLRAFWAKYSDKVGVRATELYACEQDIYRRITVPCGRNGKTCAVEAYVNGRPLIAVGDSEGDRGMFERIKSSGRGLTIGIGKGIQGDINLPAETDWYPLWAASELFAEKCGQGPAELPPHDVSSMEYNSDLGESVVKGLKQADRI